MTNWIVGHTDRFGTAVTDRSISNMHSFYGTCDFGWDLEWDFEALPWEKPEVYLERSPLTYIKNVNTPLMIVHSEQDLRCPMEQGEQFFTALKRLKKETVLVRFPDESHGLSRCGTPSRRVERMRLYLEWFEKHLS